jgi:hypothetical protein
VDSWSWELSESGFSGFKDFQDCYLGIIGHGNCLNQDFQDLRIFRIVIWGLLVMGIV